MTNITKSAHTPGRLRWKLEPRETGLRAVGAGEHRTSWLTDGVKRFACVSPSGGDWRRPLEGWYFVAGWDSDIPRRNTCGEDLFLSESEAKAAAMEYVRAAILKATGEPK
jgi:hypothetical protein